MKKIRLIIIFIFLFILLTIGLLVSPKVIYNYNKDSLIISEIMPANKNTVANSYRKYSDYIELYNSGKDTINLSNYYLSDTINNPKYFKLPDISIKPGEYQIIYCDKLNTIEDEIHANFKLSKAGETVYLSDQHKIVSKVTYDEIIQDAAYGYNGKKYVYYTLGTPGKENPNDYQDDPIKEYHVDKSIIINEYLVNNINNLKSHNNYYSLLELYNTLDKDINLEGYSLTDTNNNLNKYIFPNVTIKANDYLVIYMNSTDKYENNEVHSSINLNKDTKKITLVNNERHIIDEVKIEENRLNVSSGLYQGNWHSYAKSSLGKENTNEYLDNKITSDITINEVSFTKIELYNNLTVDIKLNDYRIGDKSGVIKNLSGTIKGNSYYTIDAKKLGIKIGNTKDIIYLYAKDLIVDTFNVNKLTGSYSVGLYDNKHVYYKSPSMGKKNSDKYFLGYTEEPIFSINGGYVNKGDKVEITGKDCDIYYTVDGTFPTTSSKKYNGEIVINKNTVIKAICVKKGYLESNIVSRTFITDKKHDIPFVSVSAPNGSFYGNGIISNYNSQKTKKVNFEFYETNGSIGLSFLADAKIVGMDSRKQPQKSLGIFLRKEYGLSSFNYPLFTINDNQEYSSFVIRNSGEDPNRVKLKDVLMVKTLYGQMDLDMQDYRAVAVYINGSYYGLCYLREKVNEDYLESRYGIDRKDFTFIKGYNYGNKEYNKIINYVNTHNMKNKANYEYIKTVVDVDELMNYWIAQTFYANTDTGNIAYWKSKDGKWRWILYDQDWGLYSSTYRGVSLNYPFQPYGHGVGHYFSTTLTYKLFQNSEFKDEYLKKLAYHLKYTFKPSRMNEIMDELKDEIDNEMTLHTKRWYNGYGYNKNKWYSNLNNLKGIIKNRYNVVLKRAKTDFHLSQKEYNKYFGDIK